MPEERLINSLEPILTPTERARGDTEPDIQDGGQDTILADLTSKIEREGEEVDPEQIMRMLDERLHDKFVRFGQAMVGEIRKIGRSMDTERSSRGNYTEICDLSEKMASTDVSKDKKDRILGLTWGWTKKSVQVAIAAADEYLFDSGPHPTEYRALGDNDEGPWKERVLQMWASDRRDKIGFRNVLTQFLTSWATFPIGVARQQWTERVEMMRDADTGEMMEKLAYRGPSFRVYDPRWVWFSDYDRPTEDDQRGVLWFTEMDLSEIEAEEAVRVPVAEALFGAAGAIELKTIEVKRGRFLNLEQVRRDYQQSRGGLSGDTGRELDWIPDIRNRRRKGSDQRRTQAPVGVLEFEGYLDLRAMVRDGHLDPILLAYLGIQLQAESEEGLIRKLNRVFWNVAVTTNGHLLQFEPTRYNPPRNTALAAPYAPFQGLLGQGVRQLGGKIEDAADKLLNLHVLSSVKNAKPSKVVNRSNALFTPHGEVLSPQDIARLDDEFDETVYTDGDATQAVHHFQVPWNPNFDSDIQAMSATFGELTRITPDIKGESTAPTATQARQNLARSSLSVTKGSEIVGRRIIEKFERNMWRDVENFMTITEFQNDLMRLAGKQGMASIYMLPTLRGLADQIEIRHAGAPFNDRIVRTDQIKEMVPIFTQLGTMDPEWAQLELLALTRVSNPESSLVSGGKAQSPTNEIRLMAMDHYVKPTMRENFGMHIEEHMLQLLTLQAGLEGFDTQAVAGLGIAPEQIEKAVSAQGVPRGLENWKFDPQIVIVQLEQHIRETQELAQAQLAAAQAGQAAQEGEEEIEEPRRRPRTSGSTPVSRETGVANRVSGGGS